MADKALDSAAHTSTPRLLRWATLAASFQRRLSGSARTSKTVLLDWSRCAAGAVALVLLVLVKGMREYIGPIALGKLARALGDPGGFVSYKIDYSRILKGTRNGRK